MQPNYFTPAEVAERQCEIGAQRTKQPVYKQFMLGFMAGIFIALASQGTSVAIHTITSAGIARFIAGILFPAGLILVVLAGGELLTGNCLMIVACMKKKITPAAMLRSWAIVFAGNLVGAMLIVGLIVLSGQLNFSGGLLGGFTIKTAVYKTNLSFINAFCMGILCNILVCAALWIAVAAKDVAGKVLAVFFPIFLFITSGFEHSIANMYYIPAGIFAKANESWAAQAVGLGVSPAQLADLNFASFFVNNLLPVTLGNIVGGAVFIGLAYGFIFLRDEKG